jgi:amidase
MGRRYKLRPMTATPSPGVDRAAPLPFPEYETFDATGLAEIVRRGEVLPAELVEAAIARIERRDPAINAVVHRMFEEARRRAAGVLPDGPFTGVPFLLKDLLSWDEGHPVRSGSRLLRDFVAPHDSETVRRYERSGIITIGRTNTPEFGLLPYTEPELYGPTRNPLSPDRTVGGSSGGSAAAVAAGYVPMAGGGDGGGSIRIPASCCGLFGLKPSRGRVPTGPDQGELWQGSAIEHVITRSVRDSAAMLDAISGPDVGAPYWAPPPPRPFAEEVGADPGRLRIAFTDKPLLGHTMHDECKAALARTVKRLEELGHVLVEDAPPVDRDAFNHAFLTVVCAELAADLRDAERLIGRRARRGDVERETWALALLGRSISAAKFSGALRYLQRASRAIGGFFEGYDMLLTPTLSMPPVPIGALRLPPARRAALGVLGAIGSGRLFRAIGMLEEAASDVFDFIPVPPIFNITGQPAMSVPMETSSDGLPIGMHFAGRAAGESVLFRLASQVDGVR